MLKVVINGGIRCVEDVREHLAHVDGVMIGREAYRNPWILAEIEECLLSGRATRGRAAVIEAYLL